MTMINCYYCGKDLDDTPDDEIYEYNGEHTCKECMSEIEEDDVKEWKKGWE